MTNPSYPPLVAEEIVRIRRRMERAGLPAKRVDRNLIIATWNIRALGGIYPSFDENPGSPKRNWRGLAHMAEIIRHFDVCAIQEVKSDLSGLMTLVEWLGPTWGLIVTDVTAGDAGNAERLAFVFDRRRVTPSGLAGELVLPPLGDNSPARQFARTPYAVSFRTAGATFILTTLHVLYGQIPEDRGPELQAIAQWLATWSRSPASFHRDHLVLGDFNIDRQGDPRFEAFTSTGLVVPTGLREIRTNVTGAVAKHYDQIAWFMGALEMRPTGAAGTVDFGDAVFREMSRAQMSFRVSDHLPLWVEFDIDRAPPALAAVLDVDLATPDPFSEVPD